MDKEQLNEEPETKPEGSEEQKKAADDLRFMRSTIENTYKDVTPDVRIQIMLGLLCLIIYTTAHFLAADDLHKWIPVVAWPLVAIGLCYAFIIFHQLYNRAKKAGFIPRLPRQVACVWLITSSHFLAWSILGQIFNRYYVGGDPLFLGAMHLSIAMSVTGILHSKEWLWGGIGIFAGMALTYFVEDYAILILGFAIGTGLIIPAIILQRNYRKQEKNHE